MPRVAALLDVQQISDITAIESEDSALHLYEINLGIMLILRSFCSPDLRW